MVCDICNDTGWYGSSGPGIDVNDCYIQCECKKMKIGKPKFVTLGRANNLCPACGKVDSPDCPSLWHLPGKVKSRREKMERPNWIPYTPVAVNILLDEFRQYADHLEAEVKRMRNIPQRILAIADQYEKDGEPGPFGYNCWGWRNIASSLRLAVKKALEE